MQMSALTVTDTAAATAAADATTAPATATPWYATVLTSLTTTYQQQQINKANLQRAQQGLAPLDPNTLLPVGIAPAQTNLLLWVGGGAVILALLLALRRN